MKYVMCLGLLLLAVHVESARAEVLATFEGEDFPLETYAPGKRQIKIAKRVARKSDLEFDQAEFEREWAMQIFKLSIWPDIVTQARKSCIDAEPSPKEVEDFLIWWRQVVENVVNPLIQMQMGNPAELTMDRERARLFISTSELIWPMMNINPHEPSAVAIAISRIREYTSTQCLAEAYQSFEFLRLPAAPHGGGLLEQRDGVILPPPRDTLIPLGAFRKIEVQAIDAGILLFPTDEAKEVFLRQPFLFEQDKAASIQEVDAVESLANPYWLVVDAAAAKRMKLVFSTAKTDYTDKEIYSLFGNKTIHTRRQGHGNQIEYADANGKAYLWYPGNSIILEGEWRIQGPESICYRYPEGTFNPETGQEGGEFVCERIQGMGPRMVEVWDGDVYGLSKLKMPPAVLNKFGERPPLPNND